jgi:uncharacterized membrane protein
MIKNNRGEVEFGEMVVMGVMVVMDVMVVLVVMFEALGRSGDDAHSCRPLRRHF